MTTAAPPTAYPLSFQLDYCACGCKTLLAVRDERNRPRRYIDGHWQPKRPARVFQEHPVNYPRIGANRVHRMRAEKALGKPLPVGAEVHHVDGTKREAYHKLLHARARVVAVGGNPNTEVICKDCHHLTPKIGRLGGRVERCPPCAIAHTRKVQPYGH